MNCLNCGQLVTGNFCSKCGQKAAVKRITVKETFLQFLGAYLSLDGPLWRTIKHLFTQPGTVMKAFIEGRRQLYYKPVPFFIVLTAIYIILRALLDYDPLKGQIVDVPEGNPESIKENSKLVAYYMVSHIDNFLLVLVFAIGGGMKLFFWKRYNFAEFLSIAFYTTGFYIFFGTFVMIFNHVLDVRHNQLQLFVLVGYLMHVMASTLGKSPRYRWILYLFAAFISLLAYVNIGFLIAYFIVTS